MPNSAPVLARRRSPAGVTSASTPPDPVPARTTATTRPPWIGGRPAPPGRTARPHVIMRSAPASLQVILRKVPEDAGHDHAVERRAEATGRTAARRRGRAEHPRIAVRQP